jgi:hypothetical protein
LGAEGSQSVNRIVAALSKLLEPAERECVCGDLEELQLSAPAAAANILGLVIRRQLAEWSYWGPWVALFGVAGLAGYYLAAPLAAAQTAFYLQIKTYLTYGVPYEPGGVNAAQQIAYTATLTSAMLLWSWACGFVLASLSRRALWMTSFLFYFIVRVGWVVCMVLTGNIILKHGLSIMMLFRLLPLDPVGIVFLLALVVGARSARKAALQQNTRLLLAALGLMFVMLLAWMETWFAVGFAHWSGQPYVSTPFFYRVLPLLAGAWPPFSIPLLNGRREKAGPHRRSV